MQEIWKKLAARLGDDILTNSGRDVSAPALTLLPPADPIAQQLAPEFLSRHRLWPLRDDGAVLTLALAAEESPDPDLLAAALRQLAASLGRRLHLVPTTRDALAAAQTAPEGGVNVEAWLADAESLGASDLHIEPVGDTLHLRLRRDGVLADWHTLPVALAAPLINRIKVLAGLDLAERRRPQDGRLTFRTHAGAELSARISILPTRGTGGAQENAVLRLPAAEARAVPLNQLGFDAALRQKLRAALTAPHGLFLITGPTGSGKTTTLYALLMELQQQGHKIVSIEDPVEAVLPGITQMQTQPEIGLDFPAGLRALLRHDPDVILIGEIRDAETAQIAVQAALTGHRVLASLHTGSAGGALARLLAMQVPAWALAEALQMVLAQRLLRRRRAEGYAGRLAVGTLLTLTTEMRTALARGENVNNPESALAECAALTAAAADAVSAGLTDAAEAQRLAPALSHAA